MLAAAFSSEAGASDRGAATEKAAQARVVIIESEGKYILEEGGDKNECEVKRLLGEEHTKQEMAECWCVLVFGDLLIYNIFAQ